jgi:hypothetical protein
VGFSCEGGEGGRHFGQACPDVGGHGAHGPCSPSVVLVACVGFGDGEAEVALDPGQGGVPCLRRGRVRMTSCGDEQSESANWRWRRGRSLVLLLALASVMQVIAGSSQLVVPVAVVAVRGDGSPGLFCWRVPGAG